MKVLGVLLIIFGITELLSAVVFGMAAPGLDRYYYRGDRHLEDLIRSHLTSAGLSGILSVMTVACGIALLKWKGWAWKTMLVLAGIRAAFGTASLMGWIIPIAPPFWIGWEWLHITVGALVIWYLLRPGVKAQFVKAATSDPSTPLGAGK